MVCSPAMLSRSSESSDRLCWCASPTFACGLTEDLSVRDPCGTCIVCILQDFRVDAGVFTLVGMSPFNQVWTLESTVSRLVCELA